MRKLDNLNLNLDFSTEESSIRNQDSLLQWARNLRSSLDYSQFDNKQSAVDSLVNFTLPQDAVVTTDQGDYSPGDTALISGSGFAVGETIELQVLHIDGRDNSRAEHQPWQITDGFRYEDEAGNLAGDLDGVVDGNIETSWFVDPFDSLNSRFELTAVGLDSGAIATTNFTDSYVISGTVFNDYDSDGVNDGTARGVGFASESGVAGITITAYNASEVVVGKATTGADGTYTLNINTDDPVRVEFTLPSGFVSTSLAGVANDTVSDIAFATTATTMDLGIHRAHEVTSGDGSSIELITVCYVAGVGGTGDSAIVIHGYNDFNDQTENPYTPKADFQEIGTVNGLAYHRESQTLFAGSFYKRHSALLGTIDFTNDNNASADTNDATGAAYTSIIYTIDNSNANETGNVSVFARLDDVVDPRGAIDSDNFGGGNYDWGTDAGSDSNSSNEIFDAVGKYGLGDLELSPDGTTLWVVNLNDQKLYKLPVGDNSDPLTPSTPASSDIDSYDLITSIINGSDDLGVNPQQNVRPFGLSIRDGLVYVGMVNTAQYDENGVEGNTTAADLRAFVYTFDPNNPTATPVQVLNIPLNYERDQVIREGNNIALGNWNPWVSTWPNPDPFYITNSDEVAYPQAILSDIDFDPDGNMILGFRDRWGDQLGNDTNAPDTATNGTELYEADAGGDILQAIYDSDTGTWSIETHVTTDGINGNNDPDGEFFRNDFFEDGAANDSLQIHAETAQGGLTVVPGFTEVVTTAYDPLDAFTGGFEWFNTEDGSFAGHFNGDGESGLEIYTGLLGKANGLGDIEFISAASDIEVGNRIWDDTNQDGIQNADETNFDFDGNGNTGVDTITVELYNSSGILIDTETTTDGEYYFSGLSPFTDYEIRLAASNFTSGQPLDGYLATLQNANSDGSDRIDSDATNSGGVPSISFTTGASGSNDYSFDFGLVNDPTTDYGDAPDTTSGTGEGDYQTTAANSGASHTLGSGLTIGSGVTADDGTLQNTDATADSDDGVTFTSTLQTTDSTFDVDVDVNLPASATFSVSDDFDTASGYTGGDGDWSDASWTDSQNNNPANGKIRLDNNDVPGQLEFRGRGNNSNSYSLSRTFDFSGATGDATLNFRASEDGLDAGEELTITISDDIGTTPVSFTIDSTATDGTDPSSSPLEAFTIDNSLLTSGATTITFVHDASAGGERVYIDDLSITASNTTSANLVGWIDFDQSGTFDSDEAVSKTVTSSGTETLTWNSFPGIIDGTTYARFRLSTDSNLDTSYATGAASDGEVEDYLITVGLDYGDAPDTTSGTGTGNYQTTSADTGASHGIINGLSIGSTVDPDNGTLQNIDADNDNTDGSDDEDGVTFTSNLSISDTTYSVDVDVTNTTGRDAELIGWIDFDQDGIFESGEASNVATVSSSGTQTLTWTGISPTAGTTYARFRLTTDTATLTTSYSTDALVDGEVEDYKINVGLDYGDAPDTSSSSGTGDYQTTVDNDGASHVIDTDLSLGSNIDADDGTLQNTDATADDIDSSDDEDGVTFTSNLELDDTSYSVTVDINNDTGSTATLIGWIDFDQSGTFDSDEATTATFSADATSQIFSWSSIPGDINYGTTYARFRLSTDGNLDSDYANGALTDGEVEDYKLTVGLDYGDARDTGIGTATGDYSTTANDGGASHVIDSDLSIGNNVDADDGTLQNTGATADDDVTTTDLLKYEYFDLASGVDSVNDIPSSGADVVGTLDPDADLVTSADQGDTENFGIRYTGYINIETAGTYTFYTTSDDGSTLSIDNSLVVDNDGLHGATTVSGDFTFTSPGYYPIEIEFFEATGGQSLTIEYESTDASITRQNIPGSVLAIDADDEDGVTFPNTLRTDSTSYSVTVDINNDTGNTATLIGWIDFDQSGTFDGDEATTTTFSADATSQTFTWSSIPEDITDGETYVRFRLSTDSNLDADFSTGQLSDGEVEDYEINIIAIDYGDAPDTVSGASTGDYETTLVNGGARHIIIDGLKLGATVDAENGTLQNTSATADDLDNNNDDNDEDGVTFANTLTTSHATNDTDYSVTIDYTNDTGNTAAIFAWIDFDQSGTFDNDEVTSITGIGTSVFDVANRTLTWDGVDIPSDIVSGTTYARFRITNDTGNLDADFPNGELSSGEVEDYLIFIEGGTDFGDATNSSGTDSYAATTTSHTIVSGLNIGSIVDNDSSPTANDTANADDNNGTDDEDGVTFSSNLQTTDTTYSVTVDAVNTTGSDAELIAWIDFDQNGVFDADEASEVLTISASGQVTLNWTSIPSGTLVGDTYARFRLNDNPTNLTTSTPTGALDGGEVEDYLITVTATDYGDAPDTGTGTGPGNYQTTENDDGAAHIIVSGLSIGGTAADADNGTLQNNAANADDNDSTDDEDGVDFSAINNLRVVDSAYSIDVAVTNTTGNNAVLVGWIDFDQSGTFDSDEAVTVAANSSGTVNLNWSSIPSDILPGTTYARFRISNDTTTLTTSYSTGLLSSGEVEDYAITIDAADYGDAPDIAAGTSIGDYSTTATDGGAAHGIDANLRLGSNLDADSGTLQNNDADADDTDGSPDDENGVTSTLTDIQTGDTSYSVDLDVFNNTGGNAELIGWIDFDRSGTFDSDEAVIRTISTNTTASSVTLTWDNNGNGFTSEDISEGLTYARFRLSSDTTTLTTSYSTGNLTDGEVEDYQINIIGVDYGDAPDDGVSGNSAGDYQTTVANGGASHIIIDDLYLGGSVDADNGTLEDRDAIADDNDNTDDEDGVTFNNILSNGNNGGNDYTVDLVVTNETGGDAKLVGWIDFDQDGDFEATEAVTQTVPHAIGGQNTTLTWTGLSGVLGGTTYARFRVTTDTDLDLGSLVDADSVGQFDSGEVEDYQIAVQGGIDYGDAPDTGASTGTGNYQTIDSDSGASHTIVSDLFIGDTVDEDDGTLQDNGAIADDNNGINDEDGVNFLATLEEGDTSYSVTVDLTNDTDSNATLVGWIDFDQDGSFEASEAATATVSSNSSEQTATLTWNGITPTAGETYARFRLSTDSALDTIENSDSTGLLSDGEVEDYHICVVSSGMGGTDGADSITADSGGSVIAGYKGQDTLTGGAGVDHFCYSESSDGVDIIENFTVGSGGDQIILTQILRDEVGYTGSDPIGDGYVFLEDQGTAGTMVQIDFDGTGDLLPKDLALVVDVLNADINETTLGDNNLIF